MLYTVAEIAERLKISTGGVYSLCQSRKLRHVRVGAGRGVIRIPEDALTEYLNGATVPAGQPVAPKPIPMKLKHFTL